MKKLLTLAKELDFENEDQYFDYISESFMNGQFTQCKSLFFRMKKEDRKLFLRYLHVNYDLAKYDYFFNLL